MKRTEFLKLNPLVFSSLIDYYELAKRCYYAVRLNLEPDSNFSEFNKYTESEYLFRGYVDFPSNVSRIIECHVEKKGFFDKCNLPIILKNDESILELKIKPVDVFDAATKSIDGFNFINVDVIAINDFEKRIIYEGVYKTDCLYFLDDMINAYLLACMKIIPQDYDRLFFKQLLVESYCFYVKKEYKMSFFILFTAFESFVNFHLGIHETKENKKALNDKVNCLYKSITVDLNENKIYSSINLQKYIDLRDDIAHGKKQINFDKNALDEAVGDFCSLFYSYNERICDYVELHHFVKEKTHGK